MRATIGVVVCDDHQILADGLAAVLRHEDDIEILAVAGSVEEVVRTTVDLHPDVVLMDYRLPDGDGAAATEEILRRRPRTRVVMLTAEGSDDVVAAAVEAGCVGFLHKSEPLSALLAAVRSAARGEAVLDPSDVERIFGVRRKEFAREAGVELSRREVEILQLLAGGRSTDGISEDLYLSTHTVRNHIRNLSAKLGAHTRLEAVAVATRQGLIRR